MCIRDRLHIGAAAATYVVLHLQGYDKKTTLTAAFLAAFICAGLYGLIPAILKVKWKVNELITCLMLNYVGTLFISWLIQGPWKDPTGFAFPRTEKFPRVGEMPTFFGTRIHAGVVIGVVIALILWFILAKTKWGYEIKLIGTNPRVAEYAGIPVKRYVLAVMFVSAGIAGLAGMSEVCGITPVSYTHLKRTENQRLPITIAGRCPFMRSDYECIFVGSPGPEYRVRADGDRAKGSQCGG